MDLENEYSEGYAKANKDEHIFIEDECWVRNVIGPRFGFKKPELTIYDLEILHE